MPSLPSIAELTDKPPGVLEQLPFAVDLQGWNSDHPVFDDLVAETQPQVIIEVGTWKGRSAAHFARATENLGTHIYCVDTWLGGIEHVLSELPQDDRRRDAFGSPRLYHQFLRNFMDRPEAARVHPVQQTSANGARLLSALGLRADLIYIDGSHQYEDVFADLCAYHPLLREHHHRCTLGQSRDARPAPVIFGDDFSGFAGVLHAVTRFAHERALRLQVIDHNFWILRSP